jgi:hypothetical protein
VKPKLLPRKNIIRADEITNIDDSIKQIMKKDKRHLYELAAKAVILSSQYPIESKSSVFDFRDHTYFSLWLIKNGKENVALKNETYRSRQARTCVCGFLQAAQHEWFGETVDRFLFKDKVTDLFPTDLSEKEVTGFLKSRGRKIFGFKPYEEEVVIEYIPEGIVLQ